MFLRVVGFCVRFPWLQYSSRATQASREKLSGADAKMSRTLANSEIRSRTRHKHAPRARFYETLGS